MNHQSSFDVLGLFYLWNVCGRLSILGKKEIYYLGPFGLACYYAGMTFIDRKKRTDALNTLTEAVIHNKRICFIENYIHNKSVLILVEEEN